MVNVLRMKRCRAAQIRADSARGRRGQGLIHIVTDAVHMVVQGRFVLTVTIMDTDSDTDTVAVTAADTVTVSGSGSVTVAVPVPVTVTVTGTVTVTVMVMVTDIVTKGCLGVEARFGIGLGLGSCARVRARLAAP